MSLSKLVYCVTVKFKNDILCRVFGGGGGEKNKKQKTLHHLSLLWLQSRFGYLQFLLKGRFQTRNEIKENVMRQLMTFLNDVTFTAERNIEDSYMKKSGERSREGGESQVRKREGEEGES